MSENPLAADLDHILEHTRELWDELRHERIFITGGTGFFGCWLLESFVWANNRLKLNASAHVLTRNHEAFRQKVPQLAVHPAIHYYSGDVRSFLFPAGRFSHIIHAAAESSTKLNDEDPLSMFETIVGGTHHMLEFARQCEVQKFLLISSGAVYGKQLPEMDHIPEDYSGGPDSTDPHSAYAEGKRAAELLSTLYAQQAGLKIKIARCFSFVGPYLPLDIHFAIGNFIRDGLNGGPIIVKGDGTPRRSYLYSADLAIWLWKILFTGQSLRPYNVGSDASLSIEEVAKWVAEEFQPGMKIEIREKKKPDQILEQYVPEISRSKLELGLDTWVTLTDAISRTVEFQKRRKQ